MKCVSNVSRQLKVPVYTIIYIKTTYTIYLLSFREFCDLRKLPNAMFLSTYDTWWMMQSELATQTGIQYSIAYQKGLIKLLRSDIKITKLCTWFLLFLHQSLLSAFQCKSIQIVLKMITIECIEILNGVEIKQINACTHINHNLFWNWEQMYSKKCHSK